MIRTPRKVPLISKPPQKQHTLLQVHQSSLRVSLGSSLALGIRLVSRGFFSAVPARLSVRRGPGAWCFGGSRPTLTAWVAQGYP